MGVALILKFMDSIDEYISEEPPAVKTDDVLQLDRGDLVVVTQIEWVFCVHEQLPPKSHSVLYLCSVQSPIRND